MERQFVISEMVVPVGDIAAGWYFWTLETGTVGPFSTEQAAIEAALSDQV